MKLNDKSLSKFATSGAPPDKEGFLLKKGEVNRGFQKRWFVLKGNLLFYYERRQDKEPIGVIVLEGCTIELSENADGFAFQINFPGSGTRTYILAADSQEEMESWMKILSCASYDYMKLMVSELQRQVDEMNSDTQQKLVDDAFRDSKLIFDSYGKEFSHQISEEDTMASASPAKRFNPFNVGSDDSSLQSPNFKSNVSFTDDHFITKVKSFTELHQEYEEQIKCLSELWHSRNSMLISTS